MLTHEIIAIYQEGKDSLWSLKRRKKKKMTGRSQKIKHGSHAKCFGYMKAESCKTNMHIFKRNKKEIKAQFVIIPVCHTFQCQQAVAKELFIRILVKIIQK